MPGGRTGEAQSVYARRNAWRDAVLSKDGPPKGITRLVLLAIGSFAGADCQCYPGMDLIAERAGVAIKTVWTHVHIAEKLGWIRTAKKPRDRGKQYVFTSYTLQIPPEIDVTPTCNLPNELEIAKPSVRAAKPQAPDAQTVRRLGLNHLSHLLTNPTLESITKPILNPGTAKKPPSRARPQTKTPEPRPMKTKAEEQEASEEWINKTAEKMGTHDLDDLMRESSLVHGLDACRKLFLDLFLKLSRWPTAEEFAAALREMR